MAASSGLRDLLGHVSGSVVLGVDGEALDSLDLDAPASPTLLVAPVTDALKSLSDDGFVIGSLDRAEMWRVVGYHLDEATSRRLAERDIEVSEIHQEVVNMGLSWQASPVDDLASAPPGPVTCPDGPRRDL